MLCVHVQAAVQTARPVQDVRFVCLCVCDESGGRVERGRASADCQHVAGTPGAVRQRRPRRVGALLVKMISLIEFIAECRLISISSPIHGDTHTQCPVLCAPFPGKDTLFSGIPTEIQLGLISIQLLAC